MVNNNSRSRLFRLQLKLLRERNVDPRGIEAIQNYLDRFWDRALAAFKAAAEKETDA